MVTQLEGLVRQVRFITQHHGARSQWLFAAFLLLAGAGCDGIGALVLPSDTAASATSASKAAIGESCRDHPREAELTRDMLQALNHQRGRRGLTPLRMNETLTEIAGFWACRLADRGFFDHKDPDDDGNPVTRAIDFGYGFDKIGENLVRRAETVDTAMEWLMSSAEHRANILDPAFSEIGIAVKLGGPSGIYWVQEFGRPLAEPAGLPDPDAHLGTSTEPATQPSGNPDPTPIITE